MKASPSKNKKSPSPRRVHETEWRNYWLFSWIMAGIFTSILIVAVRHSVEGILEWLLVISLVALAGGLFLFGLLNLILLVQKKN